MAIMWDTNPPTMKTLSFSLSRAHTHTAHWPVIFRTCRWKRLVHVVYGAFEEQSDALLRWGGELEAAAILLLRCGAFVSWLLWDDIRGVGAEELVGGECGVPEVRGRAGGDPPSLELGAVVVSACWASSRSFIRPFFLGWNVLLCFVEDGNSASQEPSLRSVEFECPWQRVMRSILLRFRRK